MSCISVLVSRIENSSALAFEATFPHRISKKKSGASWEVQLPVWRPGRYERGDFAQFILKMVGIDVNGKEIKLEKCDLHRWTVPCNISKISWVFQADILNAGSTYVSDDLQYVNPVNCFLYDPEKVDFGYEISLKGIPANWDIATALPQSNMTLHARDMQHVMDSPWMASPNLYHERFEEGGVDFHVWAYGETPPQQHKFIEDHQSFCKAQISSFGDFPTPHYHFLYLLPQEMNARHGVEHEDSTVIALGPTAKIHTQNGYDELIGIASHELYHAWNVKRIRPSEWTPYNFADTSPSQLGYVAEGVTTYMGDLFLYEAGCIDLKGWCSKMEALLLRHLNNPGRHNMSVAESSYDTWLDGYRSGVQGRKGSIYVEGAVLAFLVDTRIKTLTGGDSSLSTAMTILWERFGKPRIGLTADAYWDVLAEVGGQRLDDLRVNYADGTSDTWNALTEAMLTKGLELTKSTQEKGIIKATIAEIKLT